jgi:hypothetical protein
VRHKNRKREAEALPPGHPGPSKKQKTPLVAPPLTEADAIVERKLAREKNIEDLSTEIVSLRLFSLHPKAFVALIPDFKPQKDGTFRLIVPKATHPPKFPRPVSMCRPGHTGGDGVLSCPKCTGECIHVQVLKQVLKTVRVQALKPPIIPEDQFTSAGCLVLDKGLKGFWAIRHNKERWVMCAKRGEDYVCQEDPSNPKCWHAFQIMGKPFVPPDITTKRRYKGKPAIEWADVPLKTPVPPKDKDVFAMVCSECRWLYEHTRTIEAKEFEGCTHTGRAVHVCTPSCPRYPCSKLPPKKAEVIDDDEVLVATSRAKEMLDLSNKGFFSQDPPVSKKSPCGFHWRRKTVNAPVYNDTDIVHVEVCVWYCTRASDLNQCCTLRREVNELYYQAPSEMRVSHFRVFTDVTSMLYQGATFQAIETLAEKNAEYRQGELRRIW